MTVNEMQFGYIAERGTIDVVFSLRMLQEEYHVRRKKMYIYFIDLEKALDRVLRKVLEWAMRKTQISEVSVSSVMSLYEGEKTRVRVDSELSDEMEVKVGMHHVSDSKGLKVNLGKTKENQ